MTSSALISEPLQNLLYEKKDTLAVITINRPQVLNALNRATLEELRAAFTAVRDDPEVRVALLTGAGEKAFAAGADIGELQRLPALESKEFVQKGQAVLALMEDLGKPVIACVNGFALGAGCEIAMACSFRLASEKAKFGQPEVKLGLIPGYGGTQRLPRLIGKGRALRCCLPAK